MSAIVRFFKRRKFSCICCECYVYQQDDDHAPYKKINKSGKKILNKYNNESSDSSDT